MLCSVAGNSQYDDWEPRPVFTKTTNINMDYAGDLPEADPLFPQMIHVTSISPEATKLFDNWNPGADNEGRLKYNCKKVALLTASGNHEKTVTAECMGCAIKFMEWQVRIREMFQPGEAINVQAQFRETALRGLKTVGAEESFVPWKRVAHDRKWGKTYGDWIVKTGIEGLVEAGELVYQMVVKDREATENKGKVIINPALSGNARGKEAIKRVSKK
jgi:hypothetical protein